MVQRPWSSVAFRLALHYGALVLLTMAVVLAAFYVQTVGVLQERIDRQTRTDLERLVEVRRQQGRDALVRQIQYSLRDGRHSDTEILLLVAADGTPLAGNILPVPLAAFGGASVREWPVVRDGRPTLGRLVLRRLGDDSALLVGSDMQAQRDIEQLFAHASLVAAAITVLMAIGGAFVFRHEVEQRAGDIRRTMARVAGGDLRQRIPVSQREDEFALLNRDINAMLDRVEQLMDGVRHVSNTIAHNLRTPLTRVLLQLRSVERAGPQAQAEAVQFAAEEIAELGAVFDKLLQIAGTRRLKSGAQVGRAFTNQCTGFHPRRSARRPRRGASGLAASVGQQPLHAARDARMRDPEHIAPAVGAALGVPQRGAHARQHAFQRLAAAGAVRRERGGPGIDVGAVDGVPGPAFPGAEVHFHKPRIGLWHQIGPEPLQGKRQQLASL